MATAGSIVISLLAQTGSFETDMDRAAKKVDQTAKSIDRAVVAIGAAGAAFVTAAAAITVQTARAMDATAKMAQQIGVTTEALTSMRFAAQQFSNVSDQTFDMSMRRMTRRIEEAAAGSGAAKDALKALGLSARELAQMSPDKQFLALADALKNTDTQAKRLRYTMAIFDTEGVPMVTALQQGSKALEEAALQAERFGIVLSSEAARAAEQFATNMDHLGRAQEGFRQQISAALLPSLVSATDLLLGMADAAGPVGEKVERALTAAGVAATGAAAIFAGRFAGAATLSADRLMVKANAAIRAQYELAKLGGAGRVAAAGMTATATAARAGSLALGLVGGPLGIITTLLTAGAAAWLIWGRDAARAQGSVDALTKSMEDLNYEFLALTRNKREQMLMGLEEDMRGLQGEIDRSITKIREMSESAANWAAMPEGMRPVYESLRDNIAAIADGSMAADEKTAVLKATIESLEGSVPENVYKAMLEIALSAATGAEEVVELMSRIDELREKLDAPVVLRPNRVRPGGGSEADKAAKELQALLDRLLPAEKALQDYHKQLGMVSSAYQSGRLSTVQYTKALESLNVAYATQVKDLLPESVKKANEAVRAARQQEQALRQQIRTFGLAESAVTALAIADTDAALAKLEATRASEIADGASVERIRHIEEEIAALRELRGIQLGISGLQQQVEWLEREKQAWEQWSRDVETIFDQVGQSLTDAIFEGGKSGRDLLKDLFKTLTFRVLIQPVMGQMQGWVTNQLGGMFGVQNPQQGGGILGLASNINSLNTLAGGITQWMTGSQVGASNLSLAYANATGLLGGDSIGALIQANSGWEGALSGLSAATNAAITTGVLTAAPTVAATMNSVLGTSAAAITNTTFSAALGGGGAAASGAAGASGLISGIASAAPWIGGALAIGSAFGLFDDRLPTTRRSQRSTSHMLPDGSFEVAEWDDRQDTASQIAARDFAEAAVKHANDLFERIGIDAQIHSFQALMESSILGDRQGVGSSGQVRIGDVIRDIGLTVEPSWTQRGFGGWSDQPMLPRLQTDIQLTILEAFQAAGDQLPSVLSGMLEDVDIRSLGAEQAQALAQSFQMVIDQVSLFQGAVESLPFAQLRDLSFDAAANLIQFAGGLEALDAGMSAYFQNFYSEAEQLDWLSQQLSTALDSVGLVMPDVTAGADAAKAAYRSLVESLDLTTEEGQRAYATLMTLSGGFAELATGMDQMAEASRRAAQEQLRMAQEAFSLAVSEGEAAYNALARSINSQKTRLQREAEQIAEALRGSISAASTTVSELTSLTNRLTSTVQRMVSQGLDDGRNREWAQERIARALSVATLTGVMPEGADFEQALQLVAQPSQGLFDSFEDYQADFLRSAHDVSKLNELAGVQLTTEQRALESLEQQLSQNQQWYESEMARLDGILEYHRMQLDIAMGTYQAVLSIPDAIAQVTAAIGNIKIVQQNLAQPSGSSYYSAKLEQLKATGSTHGGINWSQATTRDLEDYFSAIGMTPEEHWKKYGRYEGLNFPGFAQGTNYVPYDMLANIHQGERIIPAADNRELMRALQSNRSNDNALRLVQQELREMRQMQQTLLEEIGRNTNDTARTNRQMTEQPQPVHVTNVVPTIESVPGQ